MSGGDRTCSPWPRSWPTSSASGPPRSTGTVASRTRTSPGSRSPATSPCRSRRTWAAPGADLATVCRAQSILAGGCASTALAANMHLFGLGAAAESAAGRPGGGQDGAPARRDRRPDRGLVHRRRDRAQRARVVHPGRAGRGRVQGPRPQGLLLPRTRARRVLRHRRAHRRQRAAPLRDRSRTRRASRSSTPGTRWRCAGPARGTSIFDDVFVPEFMAQVGTPWDEWDRRSERMLSWFACTVASVYLGIAEAAASFTVVLPRRPQARGHAAPAVAPTRDHLRGR